MVFLRWLLFSALLVSAVSAAQEVPAGSVPPRTVEVEVQSTDAGTSISQEDAERLGLSRDGGDATLVPPTLVADSPAAWPEGLDAPGAEVELELLVSEQGEVTDVKVTRAAEEARFTEAALKAAPGLRFQPATLGGAPVAVRLPFLYRFEPPEELAPALTARISGEVRARGTRRPLAGAALFLDGSAQPLLTTGPDGRFRLEVAPGAHRLEVRAAGHQTATFEETLAERQVLGVIYRLQPGMVNPYETVVRDERPRQEVTRITLQEQELREVPGTLGDPFRVIMLMPGVGSVASGLGYPVVRGGQPASTGYFLDGVRIPMLYHLLLGPAVIHPDFIDTIDFYPGAPPVQYGRLLGAAVEGRLSRPREDRLHFTAYADLLNSGGFIEYPFEKTGTSVSVAGRVSYSALLINLAYGTVPDLKEKQRPHLGFWDYQARVEQKVGEGRVRLFALGSSDDAGRATGNWEDSLGATVATSFHRVDLRGTHPLAGGEGEVGFTLGTDSTSLTGDKRIRADPAYPAKEVRVGEYGLDQTTYAARVGWTRRWGDTVELRLGGDVERRRTTMDVFGSARPPGWRPTDPVHPLKQPSSLATFAGAFAGATWRPSSRWTVLPGVRVDGYHLSPGIQHVAFEPRVAARYAWSDALTFKGGAGLYHQAPTVLLHIPAMDVGGLRYGLQEGAQFDVGAEWKTSHGFEFSADVFYNPLSRAVEFDVMDVLENRQRRGQALENPTTHGSAYGLDLMARHPLGRDWFGWVSYSFLQARRHARFARYDDANTVTEWVQGSVPFAFEQAHVFNAALSYKLAHHWTLGTVLHFNTGRPESGQLSSLSQRGVVGEDGYRRWTRQDLDRVERLAPFFRVDFRAARTWTFNDFTLDAYLDFLNLSLQQEVFAYDYTRKSGKLVRESMGLPVILPLLGLKGVY